jgi:hypothetical protein
MALSPLLAPRQQMNRTQTKSPTSKAQKTSCYDQSFNKWENASFPNPKVKE